MKKFLAKYIFIAGVFMMYLASRVDEELVTILLERTFSELMEVDIVMKKKKRKR